MPAAYSRSVQFETTDAVTCVRVPVPPRGRLSRFVLEQIGGDKVTAKARLYDRRGASSVANDINVRLDGAVATIETHTDGCLVTFTDDHGLLPTDQFELKGNSVDAYNVRHTVVAVVDATSVVSDATYTADGSGGLWQTLPFLPTRSPSSHLLLQDDVYPGSPVIRLDLDRPYENRAQHL